MTTNVIKQIVNEGEYGAQTIRVVVRSNERGPRGEQGERGVQGPQGIPGPRGADGAIQYKAGVGINISDENIITATGDATAVWGGLEGNIANQADLAPYIKKNAPIWYGTCPTANGTLTKVVAIQNGTFSYTPGGLLIVYFKNDEQATSGISLQIDGVSYEMVGLPWAAGAYVVFAADMHLGEAHKMFYNISGKAASPGNYGPTKLYNGYDSTSIGLAPTANALKSVYDAIGTAITNLTGSQFVDTANIKNNAVATAQIADEAVEVDKIDFATMKGYANSLPIATKANAIATLGGTNLTGTLTRYGDLVFLYINATIGATHTTYDQQGFGNIAEGYRPAIDTIAAGNMTSGSSQTGCFSLKIGTDGNILGSCPPTTDTTRVQVFGCWITNNTWPS